MFEAIRNWKRKRVLATSDIPDSLWREAIGELPFLRIYTPEELTRLRQQVVLFLSEKSIVSAHGFAVTPLMRVVIALQASVLTLNLDPGYYDGWETVIVYPDEFITGAEFEDEAGVVHRHDEALAGEAMPGGPVVLSWPDVEAAADWASAGMNLVIHEFAHKLDMRSGEANGCPPLPPSVSPAVWQQTMQAAFDDFTTRVDRGEETAIDAYACESPAEFFAVLSEVFFADPLLLRLEYPEVYALLTELYKQAPAARMELLPQQ